MTEQAPEGSDAPETGVDGAEGDTADVLMDKVVGLCKRRGFIFQSAEIYGGFRSTYDYGPLGVNLLRNVKNAWWRSMVQLRDDVVGLDAAILSPPAVWEASGHLANFTDPLVDCLQCHARWRADKIDGTCPTCGGTDFTEARAFNLMFKTHAGPLEDEGAVAYLPPGDGPGDVHQLRQRPADHPQAPALRHRPSGQVVPQRDHPAELRLPDPRVRADGDGVLRAPRGRPEVARVLAGRAVRLVRRSGHPRGPAPAAPPRPPTSWPTTRLATADVEFRFPWGWDELEGIADRGDFDLKAHAAASGERLDYFDPATNERYVPHVIEPAAGATRTMMAFLLAAYDEDEVGGEPRTVLRLHHRLAPYQVAVLPLSKKDTLEPLARQVLQLLQPHFMCDYDVTQGIGRRYRRQDEVGTPWCVTVDFDSLEDQAVTVRDRDSTEQERVPVDRLVATLQARAADR